MHLLSLAALLLTLPVPTQAFARDSYASAVGATVNISTYIVQAVYIATTIENSAASASFTRDVSSPSPASEILARNGRLQNTLYYLAGAYGVNLSDEPAGELALKKSQLLLALDAFLDADASDADTTFDEVLVHVSAFRKEIAAITRGAKVSATLKSII